MLALFIILGLSASSISASASVTANCEPAHSVAIIQSQCSSYQAPLYNCDADNVLPDQYIVYFVGKYTMEQHKQTVGPALQDSMIRVVFDRHPSDNISYSAKLQTKSLEIIRGDKGVEFVGCNLWCEADIE